MKNSVVKSKSIILTFLSCIIIISLVSIFTGILVDSKKSDRRAIFREISEIYAGVIDYSILSHIEGLEKSANNFSGLKKMSSEKAINLLKSAQRFDIYDDLFILDSNDKILSASGKLYDVTALDTYFKLSFSGTPNLSAPVIINKETIAVYSVPIYSSSKEIDAILCGVVKGKCLNQIDNINFTDPNNYQIILDNSGNYIFSAINDQLNLNDDFNLFRNTRIKNSNDNSIIATLTLEGTNGDFITSFKGNEYYISYNKLSNTDWYSATFVSTEYISSYWESYFPLLLAVIWGATIAIVFVLFLLIGRLFKYKERINQLCKENNKLYYVDELTGLDSHNKFLERAQTLLKRDWGDSSYAMISMNIKNFSLVNDLLGYEDGSNILIKISNIINKIICEDELFCRSNADKFLILLKFQTEDDIIERIRSIINDVYYQISEFRILTVFGIYKIERPNESIYTFIDRSILARRSVNNKNDSSYAFFDSFMHLKIREEKVIENIMEEALYKKEFVVYLQPKFDLQKNREIIGAEALIRWKRDGKMIPPGNFITLFEKNGFITKLDVYVFEEVCKQQKVWMSQGFEIKVISVNVSRVNLSKPNFVRDLYDICQRYNVPTNVFEIEITESVAFENLKTLDEVLKEFKHYGFYISIDDFGAGYSSLNMLKDLSVDVLKIDRAFLTDSDKNKRASDIIGHVIAMAVSLNMKTICEGIETKDQVDLLVKLGCDMAQGFYFARPMPIGDFEELLYGKNQ